MKPLVLIVFACCVSLPAQQTAPPKKLLHQLTAYAKDYRAKLPSLECEEDFVSQQLKKDKVKWEVKVTATLRHVRDRKDPDDFKDSYTFHSVNGRPLEAPDGKPLAAEFKFKMPYFVEGAFANGLGFAGDGGWDCYESRLTEEDRGVTTRLEFWAKDPMPANGCEDVFAGYHKIALIDTATGVIRHITRSMSADEALKHREVDWVSIDYAPQKFGDLEIWLPVHVEAHNARNDRRMIATFSNYHRFAGEVHIVPGVEPVVTNDPPTP